jgi:hypothetical protein
VTVEEQNNQLHAELLTMEHDRDHWKANHDHQVECAHVLKSRKDMPVDRVILHQALLALTPEGRSEAQRAMDVVTSVPRLEHVLDVYAAAEKLVKCKGRYHAELNYKALAALFGVEVPQPVKPTPQQLAAMQELTDLQQQMEVNLQQLSPEAFDQIQKLIEEPPAPSEQLRALMTRQPQVIDQTKNDALLSETISRMFDAVKEPE